MINGLKQRWDKLKVHNTTIKHQTQTQKGIQLFTGENQEYERELNQSIIYKQIRFKQNNQETCDTQTEH